ncbi:pseudouridine synthase [Selenomonas sp. KH1T6]|uniref:pseudouridine synthase n=1 Tax=Selenomonas sp. KH1T6 TaxID=3158784 RepID=UPI0008A80998|nr:23S rRNA pseudouridine2605 synthase [Selenomonas ruminantium]
MEARLQKIISQAGIASRRAAESIILEGRVEVDGQVIRELGGKYDPELVEIRVDGKIISALEAHVYYLLNKPKGYVSTASDERGRRTVLDLLPEIKERIYPIGRLDMNTEGLLLLTNDGELMNGLLHPRYEVQKTYVARIATGLSEAALRALREGVKLEDGLTAPARVRVLETAPGRTRVEITIHEGRNRQVRRMFKAVGHEVLALKRTAFAGLSLEGVRRGEHRALTEEEIRSLYEKAGRQQG